MFNRKEIGLNKREVIFYQMRHNDGFPYLENKVKLVDFTFIIGTI
ncbi:hypothetical protein GCM10007111_22680 [Virgibacillus kapii]|uniref:Uncharacterized protein n=1 Tax=Virgibacillus kapii TaxID=1638645 RepID=A0ABQ2DJS7_9BACI|nr:hypothetical protein GCM10007111_22680 [Virgibacillus kapii]